MTERAIPKRRASDRADEEAIALQGRQIDHLIHVVEDLAKAIRTRPTRYEVARRRRATALMVVTFAVSIIYLHDEHVEKCGPGAETKAIVEYVLETPADRPIDRKKLVEIGSKATPSICGVTFPLHVHDDEDEWPNTANIVGLLILATGVVGGSYWAFRNPPPGVPKEKDDPDIPIV